MDACAIDLSVTLFGRHERPSYLHSHMVMRPPPWTALLAWSLLHLSWIPLVPLITFIWQLLWLSNLFGFSRTAENQSHFHQNPLVNRCFPAWIHCQLWWTTGNLKCLLGARRACMGKQSCGKSVWNDILRISLLSICKWFLPLKHNGSAEFLYLFVYIRNSLPLTHRNM